MGYFRNVETHITAYRLQLIIEYIYIYIQIFQHYVLFKPQNSMSAFDSNTFNGVISIRFCGLQSKLSVDWKTKLTHKRERIFL